MAPEQGLGQPVDGRTDEYALGVVLYELLTGHKPYQADTPIAVLIKQINEPLRSVREMVSDLPLEVERFIVKTLAKQPEARYADMRGFGKALTELTQGTKSSEILFEEFPSGDADSKKESKPQSNVSLDLVETYDDLKKPFESVWKRKLTSILLSLKPNKWVWLLLGGVLFLGIGLLVLDILSFSNLIWILVLVVFGSLITIQGVSENSSKNHLAIIGCIVTMIGLILFYQTATGHWASSIYIWTLIAPTSIGIGMRVFGKNKFHRRSLELGNKIILIGLVIFAISALVFELIIGISRFGSKLIIVALILTCTYILICIFKKLFATN
jgi:hypothetical protein